LGTRVSEVAIDQLVDSRQDHDAGSLGLTQPPRWAERRCSTSTCLADEADRLS